MIDYRLRGEDVMIGAKDLIGLDFPNDKQFLECLQIIHEENPPIYFELPGGNSLIIARKQLNELRPKLKASGLTFSSVEVLSAADPKVRDTVVKMRGDYITGRHLKEKDR